MERSPDSRYVLKTKNVCPGVCKLKLKLCCSCILGSAELGQKCLGAQVDELGAVADVHAFIVCVARKACIAERVDDAGAYLYRDLKYLPDTEGHICQAAYPKISFGPSDVCYCNLAHAIIYFVC